MANHKSAEKRNRQNERRRLVNRQNLRRLRTQMKRMSDALESLNTEQVKDLLPPTLSIIDKSIQKGVLHKNAAARHKSQIMQKANALMSGPAPA
jgi:small subunit ribosomal protein S20